MYPRESVPRDIIKAAKDDRLLFLDKKRSRNLLAGRPGSNSPTTMREADFKNNITDFWGKIKWEQDKKQPQNSARHDSYAVDTDVDPDADLKLRSTLLDGLEMPGEGKGQYIAGKQDAGKGRRFLENAGPFLHCRDRSWHPA